MEQYNDNSSILYERLYDSVTGNPIIIPTTEVQECNNHGIITLSLIPNESEGLEFPELNNMHEVYNAEDVVGENDFYCNYKRGDVYLHESKWHKKTKISYKGEGISFIGANRVYTQRDKNGNVVQTLDYIIEKGWEAIESLLIIGSAIQVLYRLEQDIADGNELHTNLQSDISTGEPLHTQLRKDINDANTFKDQLNEDVADGKLLDESLKVQNPRAEQNLANLNKAMTDCVDDIANITKTDNGVAIVTTANWGTADSEGFYHCTVTHTANSKDLNLNIFDYTNDVQGESVMVTVTPLTDTTFKVSSIENTPIKIVFASGYYGGYTSANTQQAINSLGSEKQDKTDNLLATNSKVIPLAINEVKSSLEDKASKSFLNNEEVYLNRASVNRKLVKKIGNDIFVYSKKPSSEKEYIRFKLGEGASIGTTNQSVGTNYEFLRCYDVVKISDLFLLKHTPKAFSENVNWITLNINYSNNFDFVTPVEVYKQETKVANSWIEYEINTPINTNEIKTMVYKSNGSSSDVTISVDGIEVVKNYSLQDSNAGFYNIPVPISISGKHTIRFTTNVAGYMNIAGVCCIGLDDFDNAYDLDYFVEAPTTNGEYVKSNGAMDYAVLDKDTELWCGSYHGGETRTSLKFIIDGNVLSALDDNKNYICKSFEVEQETNLVNKLTTYSRQIFYYDGEIELQVIFSGSMNVQTLFTNMSTTKDTFTDIIYPVKATVPTGGKLYLVNGCNYVIQKFNDKNLKAITIINNNKTNDLPPNFKHMTGSYCKLYNANIQNDNGELFKGGQFRTIHIYD